MAIRSVALAGMVADTSLYNIDGACVVGGAAPIPVGTVVGVTLAQTIEGHKVVAAAGVSTDNVLGVVVRSHYETADGTAKAGEAVNVMTHGRIWVRTTLTSRPAFGAEVLVSPEGLVTSDGTAQTGWSFAGGFIPNAGTDPRGLSVDGALVEVQVKQK